MQPSELLTREDAVSPVIGVILMVAITVILAAVIGTFVLGLGGELGDQPPQTSFTFDFDRGSTTGIERSSSPTCDLNTDGSNGVGTLRVTHDGGGAIAAPQLSVGDDDGNRGTWNACATSDVSEVSAGDSANPVVDADDTVRVTWQAASGDTTATLGKWTGPDA